MDIIAAHKRLHELGIPHGHDVDREVEALCPMGVIEHQKPIISETAEHHPIWHEGMEN